MYGFTINDLILLIPMALAGAVFFNAWPTGSQGLHQFLRVLGALLGMLFAVLLVEGLPVLV